MTRTCTCMFPALINKVSTFQVGAKALILVMSGSLLHNHVRSMSINCLVAEGLVFEGNA